MESHPGVATRAVAIQDHHADKPDLLGFKVGDYIHVTEEHASGWWGGSKEGTNEAGWFPGPRVRMCEDLRLTETQLKTHWTECTLATKLAAADIVAGSTQASSSSADGPAAALGARRQHGESVASVGSARSTGRTSSRSRNSVPHSPHHGGAGTSARVSDISVSSIASAAISTSTAFAMTHAVPHFASGALQAAQRASGAPLPLVIAADAVSGALAAAHHASGVPPTDAAYWGSASSQQATGSQQQPYQPTVGSWGAASAQSAAGSVQQFADAAVAQQQQTEAAWADPRQAELSKILGEIARLSRHQEEETKRMSTISLQKWIRPFRKVPLPLN